LDVAWFHSWRIYLPLGVSHGQLSTTCAPAVKRRGLFCVLGVRRIECAAIRAMDQYPLNFVLLGMEQDRVTLAAGVVHGIIVRPKYGRSIQNDTGSRRVDYFEADPTSGHGAYPWL
jgi:hypothetical protein